MAANPKREAPQPPKVMTIPKLIPKTGSNGERYYTLKGKPIDAPGSWPLGRWE